MTRNMYRLLRRVIKNGNAAIQQRANFYSPNQELVTLPENVKIADYRSDTFSKPSWEMRRRMYEAKVGDDVYGEDPTVRELEVKGAQMLGKETALFVPSGTMSNLLALMSHSHTRGCEIVVGDESHIIVWEQAGAAQIAGVQLRTVLNQPDGTFDIKEMLTKVRDNNSMFHPRTTLVCIENTHNSCGGRILPLKWIRELSAVLKDLQIPLHLDGARFFNAVVKCGLPPHVMAEGCDTVNICLSKGLGAPMGSLLIGSEETIFKARLLRKALGGGMRQIGLVAAAGIYALDHMVERLTEDHIHTYNIAKAIHEMKSDIVSVDLNSVETNILLIKLDTTKVTADLFCKRLALVTEDEMKENEPASVKLFPWNSSTARLVVCCNNTGEDEQVTIKKLQRVIWEYENGIFLA
ncbi:uncharacterized protein [Halyomorpha halys]|uniref:uncharacterized protein n=1 Tax=Halyomorpha halys TaxID=286706 RepID=UPI0006D510E6|nr:probable low-specificity L-threonine aldolase 1 [Halyomorpha halys]XP_014283447.1 probable low-specificity L-threonine aldolase 1 [Halyomorpha halys]XP_014283448.1 probable low-specificity L-threonine aldolase 1 [Halyomorpha halys]